MITASSDKAQTALEGSRLVSNRQTGLRSRKGDRSTWGIVGAFLLILVSGCETNPQPVFAETWEATGYDACMKCCEKTDGITASGVKVLPGRTVACNWLPFGTLLEIDGKTYVVEDRGAVSEFGSKRNPKKRVDVCFRTHAEALHYGRRKVNVEIVRDNS